MACGVLLVGGAPSSSVRAGAGRRRAVPASSSAQTPGPSVLRHGGGGSELVMEGRLLAAEEGKTVPPHPPLRGGTCGSTSFRASAVSAPVLRARGRSTEKALLMWRQRRRGQREGSEDARRLLQKRSGCSPTRRISRGSIAAAPITCGRGGQASVAIVRAMSAELTAASRRRRRRAGA
jgi:hypothetical protein